MYFLNLHKAHKGWKVIDWHFRNNKPIWFLGDSNSNCMPTHCFGETQINSYLGASFYHFHQILEKTPTHPPVNLVVLSVGIDNRDQDPHKTSIKTTSNALLKSSVSFSQRRYLLSTDKLFTSFTAGTKTKFGHFE